MSSSIDTNSLSKYLHIMKMCPWLFFLCNNNGLWKVWFVSTIYTLFYILSHLSETLHHTSLSQKTLPYLIFLLKSNTTTKWGPKELYIRPLWVQVVFARAKRKIIVKRLPICLFGIIQVSFVLYGIQMLHIFKSERFLFVCFLRLRILYSIWNSWLGWSR